MIIFSFVVIYLFYFIYLLSVILNFIFFFICELSCIKIFKSQIFFINIINIYGRIRTKFIIIIIILSSYWFFFNADIFFHLYYHSDPPVVPLWSTGGSSSLGDFSCSSSPVLRRQQRPRNVVFLGSCRRIVSVLLSWSWVTLLCEVKVSFVQSRGV